jgi:hypothetical protein
MIVTLYILAGATDTLFISKTTKPPKIDGVAGDNDPWTSDWIIMTENKAANSSSAKRGKFLLTYDDKNLYLVAVCSGDNIVDTASSIPLDNDVVDVTIKMDTASDETGTYRKGDYQFKMRRGSIFPDRFNNYFLTNELFDEKEILEHPLLEKAKGEIGII